MSASLTSPSPAATGGPDVSPADCYVRHSNNTRPALSFFACAAPGASGVQSCCASGDYCLPSGLCKYTHSQLGGSGFYAAGCTDPTFADSSCPKLCNGQSLSDVRYDDKDRLWSCCGSNAQGGPNCDNPTNENFDAPNPQRIRPLFQAGVPVAQQSLPPSPPGPGPRQTDAPSLNTSTTTSDSTSRSRTWTRGPLVVTVAPAAAASTDPALVAPPEGGGSKISPGLAGGIGALCAVTAALIAVLMFIFCRRKTRRKEKEAEARHRVPSSTLGSYGPDTRSFASHTTIKPVNSEPAEILQASRIPSMQITPMAEAPLTPNMVPRELPAYRSQSYEPDALGISTIGGPSHFAPGHDLQTAADIKHPISPPAPEHHPALAGYTKFPIGSSSPYDSSPGVSTAYDSYDNSPAVRQLPNWKEVTLPLSRSDDDMLQNNLQRQRTGASLGLSRPSTRDTDAPIIPIRNPLRNSISISSRQTSREQLNSVYGTPESGHSTGRSRANSLPGFQPHPGLRRPSLEPSWSLETHPAPPSTIPEVATPIASPIDPMGKNTFSPALLARMNNGDSISSVYSRDEAGFTLPATSGMHETGGGTGTGTNLSSYIVSPLSPQHQR